jgi:succinoglycan biosynthesis protein ExoV
MKLYYYQRPDGLNNFGDTLNPWLWNQLIPDLLDEDASTAFVGIGTLFNEKLLARTSEARQRIIFSTGVGYFKTPPQVDRSHLIYCLRGPLSAQTLGVDSKLAIADGAILIRRFVRLASQKAYRFSYMPHHKFADDAWRSACQEIGFGYIDPRWEIEKILSSIQQTEVLLAEAMHGAIAADALRVPWIPITTNSLIYEFKWQDWCQSMAVEYKPALLASIYREQTAKASKLSIYALRRWWREKLAIRQLLRIAKHSQPFLSQDSHIERMTVRLEEKLEQLRRDRVNNDSENEQSSTKYHHTNA